MSAFIYSTQSDFDGPWLVDRDALSQLSEILDTAQSKLTTLAETLVDRDLAELAEEYAEELREKIRVERRSTYERLYALESKCKLTFSATEYIEESSLSKVLSLPEAMEKYPTSLDIELQCARRTIRVQLKTSYSKSAVLSVRTSPETDEIARFAFVEIANWATANQAPYWQRLWAKLAQHHWFLYFFLISIATPLISSESDLIRSQLRASAVEILQDGISSSEVPKALETILRLEFKVPVDSSRGETPKWYKLLVFCGLAVSVLLSIRPKLVISTRRNAAALTWWRWWMRFAGITIPGLIFGSVLWPRILEALKSAF